MNLDGQEGSGAQFYDPTRIETARELQSQRDQAEQERRLNIQSKKDAAALAREKQEEQKRERAEIRAQKQQLAREEKAKKEAQKSQRIAEAAALKTAQETQRAVSKVSRAKKSKGEALTINNPPATEPVAVPVSQLNSRGRLVRAPLRYAN